MSLNTENGIQVAGIEVSDSMLIRLGWLLPLATVVTSMSIHAFSGNARAIPFFVSESDYPGPERVVFTTGLAITGLVICILAYRFSLMVEEQDSKWNRISLSSGILSGLSLSVLAFANIYDALLLHVITTILVFVGGFVWGASMHKRHSKDTSPDSKLRKAGLWMTGLGILTMNLSVGFYVFWKRESLDLLDPQFDILNQIQPAINIAAPAEYLLIVGLMVTLASIGRDFQKK
ncbi:MAG: hypothetical protein HON05_04785 [Euryarchaeota archaeon]|nr:hypothetical protein [Euryarchaeota archaeon]MBT5026058.1 hypothetical protein [Euryarchaeota archaeon]MBT6528328.1 hypothetical protein [Euryarchaeota archaeon]